MQCLWTDVCSGGRLVMLSCAIVGGTWKKLISSETLFLCACLGNGQLIKPTQFRLQH